MKRFLLLLLMLTLIYLVISEKSRFLITGFAILGKGKRVSHTKPYVEGEVIVKFKEPKDQRAYATIAGITSKYARETKKLRPKNTYLIKLKEGLTVEDVIEELRKSNAIEYVQPNYIYTLFDVVPNDSYFSDQWHLTRINASAAWQLERGNETVVIAVIDTGVDLDHVDLASNLWNNSNEIPNNGLDDDGNGYIDDVYGWNFITNTSDISDTDGHGTHVAGIIAAVTNNSEGVAGVCWNCKLMILKTLDTNGGTTIDIVNAIYYATDNNASIISMSFGGNTSDEELKNALDYASSKGVLLIAAAGNDGNETKKFPAAFDNVLAVAATNESDAKADFSQFGAWIDLAAPGTNILSTYLDNLYAYGNGTSMSTPVVSSVAALLLSKNPNLTPLQLYTALKSSVTPVNSDEYIGTGIINAWLALSRESDAIALLNHSLRGSVVTGIVNVTGTANSSSLVNYSLCWGNGTYPQNFTCFYTGTENITNDSLGLWDTRDLIEANVTLRLVVRDNFGESFDEAILEVRNANITWPTDGELIGDELVQINATFAKHNFANYTLYYCNQTNCTLLNQSNEIPTNATLTTWNVSTLRGNYTLYLEVNYTDGIVASDSVNLTIDSALVEGFPVAMENASSAVSYDLDNDGRWEIISLGSGNGTTLKLLEGAITKASLSIPGRANCITLAELTGDEVVELLIPVVEENSSLLVFDRNFSLLRNESFTSSNLSCVAAGDLDRDNKLEFVVLDLDANATHVFLSNDSLSTTLPNLSFEQGTSAAIGNLTSDPGNELVIAVRNESGSGIAIFNSTLNLSYLYFDYLTDTVNLKSSQPLLVDRFSNGSYSIIYFLLNETLNQTTGETLNRILSYRLLDYNGSDLVLNSSTSFEGAKLLANPAIFYFNSSYKVASLITWRNFSSQDQNESIKLIIFDLNGTITAVTDLMNCSTCYGTDPIVISNESGTKFLILAYGNASTSRVEVYNMSSLTFSREVPGTLKWCGVADLLGNGEADVLLLTNDRLYAWSIPSTLGKKELLWLNGGFVTRDFALRNWSKLPSYETFNGATTRFEFLTDLTSVANVTLEREGYGRLVFNTTLDFTSLDLDKGVNISSNFIGINTSLLPQLNVSATLILANLSFYYPIIQVVDEQNLSLISDCNFCEKLNYSNGTLWFRVEHFSYFRAREANARLEIWDDSDYNTTSINRTMKFYANFTNSTSGAAIHGANVSCKLFENSTGNWREYNMSFNESSELYELNLTFDSKLNATFKIRCNASQLGYDVVELQDDFVVNNTPPTKPTLIAPTNGANLSTTNVTFNFSSSDVDGDTITYSIYVDGEELAKVKDTSYTSTLSDGSHTWFVIASDGFAESRSDTYSFTIDSIPPKVVNFSLTPHLVVNGSNITILINASDEHLDKILLKINSSTTDSSVYLTNGEPYNYTVKLPGDYNVTILINDTFGNEVLVNDSFKGRLPALVNFSASSFNQSVEINLTLVHGGEIVNEFSFNESSSLTIPSEIYNITGEAFNSTLTFILEMVNLSSDRNISINLDKLSNYEEFLLIYALDVQTNFTQAKLNLSYAEISVANEDSLKLYKCDDWNFSSRSCISDWSEIGGTQDVTLDRFTIITDSLSAFGIKELTTTSTTSTTITTSPSTSGTTGGTTTNESANTTTTTTLNLTTTTTSTTTLVPARNETTTSIQTTTTIITQPTKRGGDTLQLLVYLLVIGTVASVGTFILYRMLQTQREEERFLRKLELRKDIDRIEEAVVRFKMRGIRTGEIERELELARRSLELDDLESAETHLEKALLLLQKYMRIR